MAEVVDVNKNIPLIDGGDDDYTTKGARPKNPFGNTVGGGYYKGFEMPHLSSTRRGSADVTSSYAETSFIDGDEHTHLIQSEDIIRSEDWNGMGARITNLETEQERTIPNSILRILYSKLRVMITVG